MVGVALAAVVFCVAILFTWIVCALQGSWVPILGGIFVIAFGVVLFSLCVLLVRRIGPSDEQVQ